MENTDLKKSPYLNTDIQTAEFLSNFIKGDIASYSKLYNLHVNMLYNYGCKLTTDVELLKKVIVNYNYSNTRQLWDLLIFNFHHNTVNSIDFHNQNNKKN